MTGRKTKQNEVAGAYVLKLNCSLMFVVWFIPIEIHFTLFITAYWTDSCPHRFLDEFSRCVQKLPTDIMKASGLIKWKVGRRVNSCCLHLVSSSFELMVLLRRWSRSGFLLRCSCRETLLTAQWCNRQGKCSQEFSIADDFIFGFFLPQLVVHLNRCLKC